MPGKLKETRLLFFSRLFALLGIVAVAVLAFSFLPSDPLTREERAWLKARDGKIVVAPEKDYPPAAFLDEQGQFAGISADLIRLIERRLGVRFQFLPAQDLHGVLADLRSGKADLTTAVRETEERSEFLLFTTPYLNFRSIIVVRGQVEGTISPNDLIGKRVGVGRDYAVHGFLKRHYPELRLIEVTNDSIGLRDLSSGALDAYIVDFATASFLIDQQRITNLRIAGNTGFVHLLALGSAKQKLMLHGILQKGLSLISTAEVEALWRKWAPISAENESSYQCPWWLRLAALVLLIFSGLGAGVVIWCRSLNREVKSKTLELNKALESEKDVRKQLETALAVREEFVAIAAHELRTPLTALKLQLQLLPGLLKDVSFEGQKRFFELYRNSSRQLDQFVNRIEDLLDVLRISAGHLTLEIQTVDLSKIIYQSIEHYECELKNSGCVVTTKLDHSIRGLWDGRRVEQVVANLLSNAMKYGAGTPIEVRVERDGDRAKLVVRDQGIGLAKEDQQRIFDRFGRSASTKQYRGFGLGLYVTQQIVQAHGGKVYVESELGKGSAFIVDFPLQN